MALAPMPASRTPRMLSGLLLMVAVLWSGHDPATGVIDDTLAPETDDGGQRERLYLALSAAAMTTMMRDMQTTGSGDVDRDFVKQMVAHHQGAIDMAMALLRTGGNPRLIRLAHEIIVTQTEEIGAMRLAIAEPSQSAAWPPRVSLDRRVLTAGGRHAAPLKRPSMEDGSREMP